MQWNPLDDVALAAALAVGDKVIKCRYSFNVFNNSYDRLYI
jgi:hypothetical protein